MKKDLCWVKSFVRNSYDDVFFMGFLIRNILYEVACSQNKKSCFENRLFLYILTLYIGLP